VRHEQSAHHNAVVNSVPQYEMEVERRLVVPAATHGLQIEREDVVFDPVHLVILDEEDAALAMRVRDEIRLVLEILFAGGALANGSEATVQYSSFQHEGFLSRFGGLLEPLGVSRIAQLGVDIHPVRFVTTVQIRSGRVYCARYAELDRVIIVAMERFRELPNRGATDGRRDFRTICIRKLGYTDWLRMHNGLGQRSWYQERGENTTGGQCGHAW